MIEVPLTKGQVALIDDADADLVLAHKWFALHDPTRNKFTAARNVPRHEDRRRQRTQHLHRFLMGLDFGNPMQVDHINFDTLDNRRSNLRIVTGKQNRQHQPAKRGASSRFVGVSWYPPTRRWKATIVVDGRQVYLGYHATEEAAAEARDRYVVEHGLPHKLNLEVVG